MIKMRSILLLLLSYCSLVVGPTVNYCGAKMCGLTNSHTFCQYGLGPSYDCTGYIEVPLTEDDQDNIVARLNLRRALAAGGRLRGYPSAGNMIKLRWVDELAMEAQRWANQCRPPTKPEEHDECRDLYAVTVGQCVASVLGEAPGLRPESMVDMWFMQYSKYKGNLTVYQISPDGSYDDFAQIIWAHTYMVGCGRSRFMSSQSGRLRTVERLVCNFAPRGPSEGRPLWTPAAPATTCPPRSIPDEHIPDLCNFQRSLDESHDEFYTMSIEEHVLLNALFELEMNSTLNHVGALDELYLTKIAFISFHGETTIPNTIRKRDVNGDEEITNVDNSEIDEMENVTSVTGGLDKATVAVATTTKFHKENLIGRHKSYQMDELTPNGHAEYHMRRSTRETTEKDKEIYGEYEFGEESNERNEDSKYNLMYPNFDSSTETLMLQEDFIDSPKMTQVGSPGALVKENSFAKNNKTNDVQTTDKTLEEYLNDPETVDQLQKELTKMELTMAPSDAVVNSRHNRRDLRQLENQDTPYDNVDPEIVDNRKPLEAKVNLENIENQEGFENFQKRFDPEPQYGSVGNASGVRGNPMDMVLKFMPYLKSKSSLMVQESKAILLVFPLSLVL